jgi:PAS domain S-box-containing protein
MKILIVDDDPSGRNLLKQEAERWGHEVLEAKDGQEGLEKASRHKPDAIISDILMPKMDGFQFLMAVRQDEYLCSIPFVFYTGIYTDNKEYALAFSLGADALIAKPKKPEDFWKEFTFALEAHGSKKKPAPQARPLEREEDRLSDYCRLVTAKLEEKVRDLEKVIAEHERTKASLRKSEERYRLFFESNPHPMWVYDLETLAFLAVNEAAIYEYGYSREEFTSMTIKDIRPVEDINALLDKVSKVREGFDEARIWRHRKKDGSIIEVEISSHTLNYNGRRAKLILAIDVTERRRLEQEVENAAGQWRSTFDAMSDGIFLLDPENRILRCNRAMAALIGKDFPEILGHKCWEIVHGTSIPIEACPHELMKKTLKKETIVLPVGPRWFEASVDPFFDSEGNLTGAVHIMTDITEQKRNQEQLSQSEQRYRNLVDDAQDVIFTLSKDGALTSLNPAFETITGWSRAESIGRNFAEFVHPDDMSNAMDYFLSVMRGESPPLYVLRVLHKSGEYLYGEFLAKPDIQDGNIVGLSGIARDITERKRNEELIKKISLQQKAILSNIPDMAWLKDMESRFLAVNESFGRACGMAPHELVGKTDLDIWPKDLAERYRADDREVMESGKQKRVEEPLAEKEGKTIWIETIKTPIFDEKGNIIGTTGIARDITKRKNMEEAIERQKQFTENLIQNSAVATFVLDAQHTVLIWNRACEELTGFPAFEMLGTTAQWRPFCDHERPVLADIVLSDDPEKILSLYPAYSKSIFKSNGLHAEEWCKNLNGRDRYIMFDAAPIYDTEGNVIAAIETLQDITKRKLAEEQVFLAKQEWEETFNTITDMVTVHDRDYNIIRANNAAKKILGLPFLEVNKAKCFDYFHGTGCPPEGCPSCRSLVTGKPSTSEMYEPHLKMFIEISAIPRIDSNNQIVGLIHVVRDISERRKAEDVLKEERNRAQQYLDVAGVMIVALDSGGRTTLINKKGLEILGYEEHEVINQNWFDLCIPGHVREGVRGVFNKLMAGDIKLEEYHENPIITKSGEERILAFHNAIIQDVSGMMSGALSSGEDITERKKSEEALKIYSHELTSLNMASDTLMLITNVGDIYQEICDIIYTVFYLKMVWLGIVEEGSFEVNPVAFAGFEDGYLSNIRVTWDDSPRGMGPTGMAIKTKRPFKATVNDQAFGIWKSEAEKRGYVSLVSMPLVYARDKCLGALNFYSDKPDYFTPDRIRLCQIFANQAAIAIENAHLVSGLEVEVRKRTRALEDTNLELQQLNKELYLRREESEAASRSKTDFLANMSHELRTPLNAIMGFSDIMQQGMAGPVTDKQKEFLRDIYTSGEHLLTLITDILDLSKIEAGKIVLEPETFTVKELIEASFIMFKEKALKHHIKVTAEIDDTLTSITADKRKLKQVLMNLLGNAFKFTPDGGSVGLSARKIQSSKFKVQSYKDKDLGPDRDFVEITVFDTGIGISEENQQRLFQPFQQIETSITRKYAGTGLGLSLCRRFVELHGGWIWVESEPGKGSRFVFVIPMDQ